VRLGLDTSTSWVSLALASSNGVIAEQVEGPPQKQSQLLPGMVHQLLAAQNVPIQSLTGLVVGLGPGSFTGLRVGLATAKGLAYALKLEVVGVSSLAAVALDALGQLAEGSRVATVAVARRDELYVGIYQRTGAGVVLSVPEQAVMVPDVPAYLAAHGDFPVAGPALETYRQALVSVGMTASSLLPGYEVPSARALLSLATFKGAFDAQSLFALEPHYIKTSGAEQNPKFPPLPGQAPVARIRED